ncbi:MAG: hypothetical protein MAGBODY4_00479 [Candidatus Marinimicrobia bacterium]|nr:hypothetical protein [Candidatus Neomarinimicrobiota bacterium]
MKKVIFLACIGILFTGNTRVTGANPDTSVRQEAQTYLDEYTDEYQSLYYASSKAEWEANTHIVPGDPTNAKRVQETNEALSRFTGSAENIRTAQKFLKKKEQITPLQVNQFERILYIAANNPQTVEELVKKRIAAEAAQNENLYGYDFTIGGESVSANDIDEILTEETDLDKRLETWQTSKEVGAVLKDGLVNLRNLRNQTVQALGYDDYFTYQVSDYGMTRQEMTDLMRQMNRELYPLYREIHTFARYELAEKYGVEEVPEMLPAHWLPNRWGQDWASMVEVEGMDLDAALKKKNPEWFPKQAERFYVSLGFEPLPQSFWELSSLYPLPEDADYKKNNHASAWHLNLDDDVRCLQSVVPNSRWYETTHHELGHIYYFIAYSNPEVPLLLREGANRAYHEAVGSLMGLAAMQKPFLDEVGVLPKSAETDEMQALLKEALNYVVFIPWSAGVMTEFENDLYAENLSKDAFNARWWELKREYQGIVPPEPRGEEYCDAASKTHINNDAAQYYDYAMSYLILFQLHDHISRNILNQDPHSVNYYGSKEVGDFLKDILEPGATKDWRKVLRETTGQGLSAKPMVRYFDPLMEYLHKQNEGRTYTLPPLEG